MFAVFHWKLTIDGIAVLPPKIKIYKNTKVFYCLTIFPECRAALMTAGCSQMLPPSEDRTGTLIMQSYKSGLTGIHVIATQLI